jgi:hypothetical protein
LRRSPAFVCDCFLNSWKRILNEQEKIDLFFRQSTLSGILGQSAAMFHQMLAGLFQVRNVIFRHLPLRCPAHGRTTYSEPRLAMMYVFRRPGLFPTACPFEMTVGWPA